LGSIGVGLWLAMRMLLGGEASSEGTQEGPPFPAMDQTMSRLAGLEGLDAVQFAAQEVKLDLREETAVLVREAEASYDNASINSDTLSLWFAEDLAVASGRSRLIADRQEVTTDSTVVYDMELMRGSAASARSAFADRGTDWFSQGHVTVREDGSTFVEVGSFTSCDIEDDLHYWFRIGTAKVWGNLLMAWPVALYVHGVPVLWLPFFAQDTRDDRRSGFLPPRFGINDIVSTSGNQRRSVTDVGYYVAINDYADAQATLDWYSGEFTRINGSFRYDVVKNHLQGAVSVNQSYGEQKTLQIQARHNQSLSPQTTLRANANIISNTKVYERQSFNPTLQTQRVSSDLGFQHRFPFASMNISASRRQDLGAQAGQVNLTLPNLGMTFTPLTLLRAPSNRSRFYNNIVVSGSFQGQRLTQSREEGNDNLSDRASASTGIRLGSFGVSARTSYNRRLVTFFEPDPDGPLDKEDSSVDYGGSLDYQVDLIGSTTLRPTISWDAEMFKNDDTEGEYVNVPARMRFGAQLATDLYGFFPGVGPFARIRHKVSPRFGFDYSPAVEIPDSLLAIPGFPGGSSGVQNRLSLTINQTFEAKLREDIELDGEAEALLQGRMPGLDSLAIADSTAMLDNPWIRAQRRGPRPPPGAALDSAAAGVDSAAVDSMGAGADPGAGPVVDPVAAEADSALATADSLAAAGDTVIADSTGLPGDPLAGPGSLSGRYGGLQGPPRRAQERRNVVLLGINSSALQFDFSRENQPALITDNWSHRINSDLLRGLSFNMSFDLFEGSGEERTLSPFLSAVTGSFTFSSATGLGGIMGLGSGGGAGAQGSRQRLNNLGSSRYRLQSFNENPDPFDPGLRDGGPWTLSLTYSLQKTRGTDTADSRGRQSINAVLSMQPSPSWGLTWGTSYNLTDSEFGEHRLSLDRDLHRWVASFLFARAPNGNFIFQMSVRLADAPDLKFDYDQRTSEDLLER